MNGKLLISLCAALLVLTACRNTANGNSSGKSQSAGIENGHAYVDLGLSVRWATCNVGAKTPEEYGDRFAWAETSVKSNYDWTSLKYCHSDINLSLSKYIAEPMKKVALQDGYRLRSLDSPEIPLSTSTSVFPFSLVATGAPITDSLLYFEDIVAYAVAANAFQADGKTVLEASDDAASVNWGGSWHMPTRDEWLELFEKCTWNWTAVNGVSGHVVTSKTNGNSIFLPATGLHYGQELQYDGTQGYYWCSSLEPENPWQACSVFSNRSAANMGSCNRNIGLSVRPVCAR